jgi:hypothetical protein
MNAKNEANLLRLAQELRFLLDMWISLLACCCIILPLAGCASSSESAGQNGTVVGQAQVVGNEPFTRVGLLTDSGTVYLLECSKDDESVLRANQGRFFRIHFRGIAHAPEGVMLHVESVEVLKTQKETEGKRKS